MSRNFHGSAETLREQARALLEYADDLIRYANALLERAKHAEHERFSDQRVPIVGPERRPH
jgi:hypothetical protein